MAFRKCPRCELNYIQDGEKLCAVCKREVKGEPDHDTVPELCSECGERPAVAGGELCLLCLKELGRRGNAQQTNEEVTVEVTPIDIDMVSTMDEIQIDIDDDIPQREFDEMESEFGSDDEIEGEEEDADEN